MGKPYSGEMAQLRESETPGRPSRKEDKQGPFQGFKGWGKESSPSGITGQRAYDKATKVGSTPHRGHSNPCKSYEGNSKSLLSLIHLGSTDYT